VANCILEQSKKDSILSAKCNSAITTCSARNAEGLLDAENLTPEATFFWRIHCQFAKANGTLEDEMLPDATPFCNIIMQEHDAEHWFVNKQLIRLCSFADFQDESGRRQLLMLFREFSRFGVFLVSNMFLILHRSSVVLDRNTRRPCGGHSGCSQKNSM
jgi:hypothetical protein